MATATTFYIKRGDDLEPIRAILKDGDGAVYPLGGAASVRFHMSTIRDGALIVDAAAVVEDPDAGRVRYDWIPADVDTPGRYHGEWEVTFTDGRKRTFPNPGFMTIEVASDLA